MDGMARPKRMRPGTAVQAISSQGASVMLRDPFPLCRIRLTSPTVTTVVTRMPIVKARSYSAMRSFITVVAGSVNPSCAGFIASVDRAGGNSHASDECYFLTNNPWGGRRFPLVRA